MSQISKAAQRRMYALADERAGVVGLVQCEGCPPGVLVPPGAEHDGLCPSHYHQAQFRYGIEGGISHVGGH